jgi:hypothetical protein
MSAQATHDEKKKVPIYNKFIFYLYFILYSFSSILTGPRKYFKVESGPIVSLKSCNNKRMAKTKPRFLIHFNTKIIMLELFISFSDGIQCTQICANV